MYRLALVLSLALSWSALAANPRATSYAEQARAAFNAARYKEAIGLLKQAYEIDQDPVLLFNLARAYEQAAEIQLALETFRLYVSQPNVKPEQVKKANLAMDRLRTMQAKAEADAMLNQAEKKRLESEAKAAQARADAEREKARLQKAEFDAAEERRKREAAGNLSARSITSIALGGLAVASFAVMAGVGVAANNSKNQFLSATTVELKRDFETQSRQRALIADIFMGIGAAAALTAIILFPWGQGSLSKSTSVAVAPTAGGALFSLGGSF